jgi:chromosomal replication initiation ATPase DnaA
MDLLVIDDIHFWPTNAMQEEFLHTFNTIDLPASRSCSPDAHPKQIDQLCKACQPVCLGMVAD